tara:strand:- start:404 stop:568 length:165 start_codon:yes stop_codon:yes gene_type:complete
MVSVREIQENNIALYQCEECELKYRDAEFATKCEAWCKEHKSCNLDIISHAEKV